MFPEGRQDAGVIAPPSGHLLLRQGKSRAGQKTQESLKSISTKLKASGSLSHFLMIPASWGNKEMRYTLGRVAGELSGNKSKGFHIRCNTKGLSRQVLQCQGAFEVNLSHVAWLVIRESEEFLKTEECYSTLLAELTQFQQNVAQRGTGAHCNCLWFLREPKFTSLHKQL